MTADQMAALKARIAGDKAGRGRGQAKEQRPP